MVCYAIPSIAAIAHYFMRKRIPSMKNSKHHLWLNQLLLGGAIFGVVDHLWNGELLLIGDNLASDIALGITITLAIIGAWKLIVLRDKRTTTLEKAAD